MYVCDIFLNFPLNPHPLGDYLSDVSPIRGDGVPKIPTSMFSKSISLLAGGSHPKLASSITKQLGVPLTSCLVPRFSNGEINVELSATVRGTHVFIIQTGCEDVNDNLMELFMLVHACKQSSARRVTAVIPCFPYARMDKCQSRSSITAKLIADMLASAGCDSMITVDLHAPQIQGFFNQIPAEDLTSESLMVAYIKANISGWQNSIIVSPGSGGTKRVTRIADQLGVEFALINRKHRRTPANTPEQMELMVGDVRDKVAILVDNMIDAGHTLVLATQALHANGAKAIYAFVSHGLFGEVDMPSLHQLPIEQLVVTDTLPQAGYSKQCSKLRTISIGSLIVEEVRRCCMDGIRHSSKPDLPDHQETIDTSTGNPTVAQQHCYIERTPRRIRTQLVNV